MAARTSKQNELWTAPISLAVGDNGGGEFGLFKHLRLKIWADQAVGSISTEFAVVPYCPFKVAPSPACCGTVEVWYVRLSLRCVTELFEKLGKWGEFAVK